MAISSGKSSSMVVVLLVAVVAATCAPGAQAQFDFTNTCSKSVIIPNAGTSLFYGGSFHVSVLPNAFFIAPFKLIIRDTLTLTVTIGTITLDWLNQLGDRLHKVEIRCDGNSYCITLSVTYTPVPNTGTTATTSRGPFCS